jgi:8-oxo-dGTP pyrophosphatase MutT (NUDIX family)
MQKTKLKNWTLISKQDVSPSKWFTIEKRKYKLPNGKIIDDFFVNTLPDAARIIPITKDKKIIMIRQFKAGANKIILEFPAGRFEIGKHKDILDCARQELEEETGIKVASSKLILLGKYSIASTKTTEVDYSFVVFDAIFNTKQKLDITEDIEIVALNISEIDDYISKDIIADSCVLSDLYLLKLKYGDKIL